MQRPYCENPSRHSRPVQQKQHPPRQDNRARKILATRRPELLSIRILQNTRIYSRTTCADLARLIQWAGQANHAEPAGQSVRQPQHHTAAIYLGSLKAAQEDSSSTLSFGLLHENSSFSRHPLLTEHEALHDYESRVMDTHPLHSSAARRTKSEKSTALSPPCTLPLQAAAEFTNITTATSVE